MIPGFTLSQHAWFMFNHFKGEAIEDKSQKAKRIAKQRKWF